MLILGRTENQKIMIGDNITIAVVSISGDRVRIGIDAPQDVMILREELINKAGEASVERSEGDE